MRNRFDQQLLKLNSELIEMGSLCEEAIAMAAKALSTKNTDLLRRIDEVDTEIDKIEGDIEALCLKLLLQQQPVARDLRQISAALKMITDMERIGDQCADIAEIIPLMKNTPENESNEIGKMAEATIKMVTESIEAFVHRDVELALSTIGQDDLVDNYFCSVKTSLISSIANHPEEGEDALDLLMIAKYFERIGDHATNIAEWVVFSVTGKHVNDEQ